MCAARDGLHDGSIATQGHGLDRGHPVCETFARIFSLFVLVLLRDTQKKVEGIAVSTRSKQTMRILSLLFLQKI